MTTAMPASRGQPGAPALKVVRGAAPAGWDRCVQAVGGGPFHCTAWGAYRAATAHKRSLFFAWYEPGALDPVSVAVGIETALPGPLAAKSIHFDAPPAGRPAPARLAADIRRWMRTQRGVADACLGSLDSDGGWEDCPEPATRIEFHVEPASEDELLSRMRTLARRSIRRAERAGIEIDDDSPRLSEFVELYGATLRRLHTVKGIATTLGDPERLTQRLTSLRDAGVARLFLASASGVPVAGCLFTGFGERSFYLLGGTSEAGRQTGATAAILHRAMSRFSAEGFQRINLGGVSPGAHEAAAPDHGLYAFKLGLGAVPHPCRDVSIIVRPARRRLVATARAARSSLLARPEP
jgi:hypothetical protein